MTRPASNPIPPPALRRAWQWDLARQVERIDWLEAQLPRYADWGYQELYLHLEDAVDYPSLPGVARRDAYSYRQLERLVAAAGRAGVTVVPIANLLGHTQYLIKVPEWRDLNERRAPDGSPLDRGQICPVHPRTLELAARLLRDVAPLCTGGKVHVGLDESYALGRHPLGRAEIAEIGLAAHFARYVGRLHGLAADRGLRLGLWADMLALLPGAIPLLPADVVAYDWYYYPFRRRPRMEPRNFAEYDLAGPLRARGIESWGCPMSGAFRHEPLPIFGERLANIADWWRRCRRTAAAGLLVTSWEPQRLAAELPALVDAAAAGLWLEGEEDPRRLLELGCRRVFGAAARRVFPILRAADENPFSGYERWQVGERWDSVLTGEPLAACRREARACRERARRPGLPPAVAASLRFRAYLADRDLFVRESGQGIWRLRRTLARGGLPAARREIATLRRFAAAFGASVKEGRAAARAMWRRTRARSVAGPNERMVAEDALRLRAWTAWLRRAAARPSRAAEASPMAGTWQVVFTATNFAPALQKVVVERLGADGAWAEVRGLFLVEFRARAARPRARLAYRLSAPLDWAGPPAAPPRLRLTVRGLGRIKVGRLLLTDGVRSFASRGADATIGRDAPHSGFPDFDWETNRGTWEPELSAVRPFVGQVADLARMR